MVPVQRPIRSIRCHGNRCLCKDFELVLDKTFEGTGLRKAGFATVHGKQAIRYVLERGA